MTQGRATLYPAVLALSLALTTGGCSFLFSHGPPDGYEAMERVPCTESNAPPILDIVWGGLNLLAVFAVAADPDAYRADYGDPEAAIVSGVLWTGLSAAAAVVGFNKAKRCREARYAVSDREARNRDLADSLGLAQRAGQTGGAVQAVVVSPHADTVAVGQRVQLEASAHASSGTRLPVSTFRWSSSNDAIASVSAAGLVTAHAPGTAVIAAGTGNVVGTATILVTTPR